MNKLAIITTHPIQYNAPFFKLLAESKIIQLKVFYTWGTTVTETKFDPGFQRTIDWDIPLLEGYEYEFLRNTAKEKGSHHFNGIINPGIVQKIKSWQPDALLIYGWKFDSHLKVMRYFKKKIPVWFRGDSTLLDEKNKAASFFKSLVLKKIFRNVDIAFYSGTNNKKYFLKYGMKENQLVRALHAVDNERFFYNSQYAHAAAQWRSRLNITTANIVFLYAGKLEIKKNVETLLNSFKELNKENVHLVIVGNGPEEKDLKLAFSDIKNIHFIDFQNQQVMPVIYQVCNVFVLPSVGPGETWGLSINEAMAAGKAILASDKCGGAIDLVQPGENGFIFEARNISDITSKIKSLAELPDKIAAMGQKSRQFIEAFTLKEFVIAIEIQITDGKNN
ncbi:MAG: glycosyltransferase family 4 protein [Ginsengibacter sp.]